MENSTSGFSKIIGYLAILIIGFGLGYWLSHKTGQGSNSSSMGDTTYLSGPHSHRISDSLAHKLMADYINENDTTRRPIKNDSGQNLRGFFINRQPLDNILKNKSIGGISIYLGVDSLAHATGNKNKVYTLIYMGGSYNPKFKLGGTESKIFNKITGSDTSTYDFAEPCPNACGTFLTVKTNGKTKK